MTELKYLKKAKQSDGCGETRVLQIKTDDIRPNRAQPRADFDQNAIIRLADSIRRYGILQPLTVRLSEPDDIYGYELIAGERRLRAAKMLGYLTVPCVVMNVSEQTSAELAIIENLLREDLNMFEQAYGFRKLIENHRLTQEEVARKMSMSQSAVANKLRLLRLSYEEQRLVLESGLTERHARGVLRIDEPEKRIEVLHTIIDNKMNVQKAEEYIDDLLEQGKRLSISQKSREVTPRSASRSEQEWLDMVQSLRKKVDLWNKNGKQTVMTVDNNAKSIEVTIRFTK